MVALQGFLWGALFGWAIGRMFQRREIRKLIDEVMQEIKEQKT